MWPAPMNPIVVMVVGNRRGPAGVPGQVASVVVTRPLHLDLRLVGLVAAGGAVGTTARWALTESLGTGANGWPTATFVANLLGSFLLGALLEALLRRGSESQRGRLVRLGAGTGVLGGFTTMSAASVETFLLLDGHHLATAAAYCVGTLAAALTAVLVVDRRVTLDDRTRAERDGWNE